MDNDKYLKDVKQINGCRVWENPLLGTEFQIPKRRIELFIKNIPNDLFELDILPHFERFGPIYQFRLLVDYENCNRGFAYLIFMHEKSALCALDVMGYFIIKPGVMLEVERSQERSHLLALNIPSTLTSEEIESGFRNLYTRLVNVKVNRENNRRDETCSAILAFPDHTTALSAKRWSGIGSVNIWNRNIKILWARVEQVTDMLQGDTEAKHVLVHNVPEDFDPDDFGKILCEHLSSLTIVSIRQMRSDWLVEFTNTEAAYKIFIALKDKVFGRQRVTTEWVTPQRLKAISFFADFDFELRCICVGNYWDPPIFIYGRVIPFTQTQICSVIIKNNRKNQFTTFFIEMFYEDLIDIHARVCEVIVLIIMEMRELPRKNIVIKCCKNVALIVGAIPELDFSMLQPSISVLNQPVYLYLSEIFAISKMCYELIATQALADIYKEYELILKEKNLRHQFICGVSSEGNLLGCIDPIYRHGKPLKYQMDSRHMILAMCDNESLCNVCLKNLPALTDIGDFPVKHPLNFKLDRIEMIPLEAVQRQDIHYTYRPFIEFNRVDTFALTDEPQEVPQWIQAGNDQRDSLVPLRKEQLNFEAHPTDDLDALDLEEILSFMN